MARGDGNVVGPLATPYLIGLGRVPYGLIIRDDIQVQFYLANTLFSNQATLTAAARRAHPIDFLNNSPLILFSFRNINFFTQWCKIWFYVHPARTDYTSWLDWKTFDITEGVINFHKNIFMELLILVSAPTLKTVNNHWDVGRLGNNIMIVSLPSRTIYQVLGVNRKRREKFGAIFLK